MTIKLEDGVPIAPRGRGGPYKSELRLMMEKMKVGQSFVIEDNSAGILSVKNLRHHIREALGYQYQAGRDSHDNTKYRVWRVK